MALKIPPVALVLITAFLMWIVDATLADADGASWMMTLAIPFSLAGLIVCGLGVISFRRTGTTVNPMEPERATTLVANGIYRHSRNPMYLGFALLLLAWGFFLSSAAALLVVPLFVVYMNRFQIMPEERALESLFGQKYVQYKQSVRRWL